SRRRTGWPAAYCHQSSCKARPRWLSRNTMSSSTGSLTAARPAERAGHEALADGGVEVSIILPCLNEARTVGACVAQARAWLEATGTTGEVIVVDNGSTDGSVALAEAAGATVLREPK